MGSARDEPVPDEDALQDWLEEAYANQGYSCYNWHKMERVNEKGIDIECVSTQEKVLLAVKIRLKTTTLRLVTQSISEIYECEHGPNRQFESNDFVLVWGLKSAAVKLKADIRLTKNYFGDKILREKEPSVAARITESAVELIDMMKADAEEFHRIVSRTRKEAPHILRAFIDHISPRTGGKELHASMQETETARKTAKIEEWLIEDKEAHKFLSALSWLSITLENLEDRFSLFSYGVDWVFEQTLFQNWKVRAHDLSDD